MRVPRPTWLATATLAACAHGSPEQAALLKARDCAALLRAAEDARSAGELADAAKLSGACPQAGLDRLVEHSSPADALLWCGRARTDHPGGGPPACSASTVSDLRARLRPRLRLGPSDEEETGLPDLLRGALAAVGPSEGLVWDADEPDVVIGALEARVDHVTGATVATVTDAHGGRQHVPAVQHRFIGRIEALVDLGGHLRRVRASEEARDLTWGPVARLAVAGKEEPGVPADDELLQRTALTWVRTLVRLLRAVPPETIAAVDPDGCVSYGYALNLASGDPMAAASGLGDPAKVAGCEHLLGEPAGAGIPVP